MSKEKKCEQCGQELTVHYLVHWSAAHAPHERQLLSDFVKEAQKALASAQRNFKGHLILDAQMDVARAISWGSCAQKLLFVSEQSRRYMSVMMRAESEAKAKEQQPPPLPAPEKPSETVEANGDIKPTEGDIVLTSKEVEQVRAAGKAFDGVEGVIDGAAEAVASAAAAPASEEELGGIVAEALPSSYDQPNGGKSSPGVH